MTTLKERIAELEGAVKAAEERASRVREYWTPIKNHPAGDHIGIAVRTRDTQQWAIVLEFGLGHAWAWTDGRWRKRDDLQHNDIYCWTLDEAEEQAPKSAANLPIDLPVTVPGEAERTLADELDHIIRTSRAAVEAFAAEPVEDVYARLLGRPENLAEFAKETAA